MIVSKYFSKRSLNSCVFNFSCISVGDGENVTIQACDCEVYLLIVLQSFHNMMKYVRKYLRYLVCIQVNDCRMHQEQCYNILLLQQDLLQIIQLYEYEKEFLQQNQLIGQLLSLIHISEPTRPY